MTPKSIATPLLSPLLTRRRFIAVTGAVASTMLLDAFPSRASSADTHNLDSFTLRVGYSERELAGLRIHTRTYNSSFPGPLLVTRPGHILRITVVNKLPPDPPA